MIILDAVLAVVFFSATWYCVHCAYKEDTFKTTMLHVAASLVFMNICVHNVKEVLSIVSGQ